MQLPPPEILAARLSRLRQEMRARDLDALIVTHLPNVAYLTGFFASAAAAIVQPEIVTLIGDSRYADGLRERAAACPFLTTLELGPGISYDQAIVRAIEPLHGLAVGFEASHVTVRRHHYFTQALAADHGAPCALKDTDGLVESLRWTKDAWEVARLRDGATRLSSVAKCILPNVLAGRRESEVAAEIDAALRYAGFERTAFDTIVASGPNAALPHARAGERRIEDGDLVVIDFGGVRDGYCTDLTRTVVAGRRSQRADQVVAQVIEAQHDAFARVAPGTAPERVDAAARAAFARHGSAEAFTHGTGHGLGLEVHEAPRVSRAREGHAEPALVAGQVLTLEPGLYYPGWGGARIEDDVLVTPEGAEWLTDVPRQW